MENKIDTDKLTELVLSQAKQIGSLQKAFMELQRQVSEILDLIIKDKQKEKCNE